MCSIFERLCSNVFCEELELKFWLSAVGWCGGCVIQASPTLLQPHAAFLFLAVVLQGCTLWCEGWSRQQGEGRSQHQVFLQPELRCASPDRAGRWTSSPALPRNESVSVLPITTLGLWGEEGVPKPPFSFCEDTQVCYRAEPLEQAGERTRSTYLREHSLPGWTATSEELLQAAWCQHGLRCGRLAQRYGSASAPVWALSSHLESCSLCNWYVLGKESQKERAIFCRVNGSAGQC